MRALVVTSEITFCPANYDPVICGLARCPEVGGLLVLTNRSPALYAKALGAIAMGARGTGQQLLANLVGPSAHRRRRAYAAAGKPTWTLPTVNTEAFRRLVAAHGFDLVVNARTRFIYGAKALEAPRLGCINLHHGLLPEQRGTMCDLWALYEGQPAGFTIHQMTRKVDDGPLLLRVEVSAGGVHRDYQGYLRASAHQERAALAHVLGAIERAGRLEGAKNAAPPGLAHRRNPTFAEIRAMRARGMTL